MTALPPEETVRERIMSTLSAADVRVFTLNGEPWFPINDLVAALGVPRRTLDYHVGHLPDDERRHVPRPTRLPTGVVVGPPGLNCVSLPGLFKLLLRTDCPPAAAFQDWVCRELLMPMWDRELDRP